MSDEILFSIQVFLGPAMTRLPLSHWLTDLSGPVWCLRITPRILTTNWLGFLGYSFEMERPTNFRMSETMSIPPPSTLGLHTCPSGR
jgi:hypothetical protein